MAKHPEELIFLSALLGRRAKSKKLGTSMGRVHDVVATLTELYPQLRGFVLQHKDTRVLYPATAQEYFDFHHSGVLIVDESRIASLELGDRDFSLRELLWDKQIVDVDGAKVVRVNDVQLLVSERQWVVHVDVGLSGLMRRLGFEGLARGAAKSVGKPLLDELISWKFVQPLSAEASALDPVRLTVGARKLNELHPGELADILEDLDSSQRQVILESLDTEIAAEAIQETDEDVQRAIFEGMNTELAADILEEMEPAKAADVLANLDEEASSAIIEAFEGEEEKADLQELLTYEDNTAGALMSTDYLEINGDRTVGEALEIVREAAGEIEAFYYVYVHDDDGKLVGALSLRHLLQTDPALQCGNVVQQRLVSLELTSDIVEIVTAFLRYNFLCLPVSDESGVLRGVISFKHSFDQLLPHLYRAWKAD
ncbi:magnesium transporter [candidate division KSB1 bacterium]|nr:magnesium transporter [candidate division KSB1 bacterium]